MISMYRLTLSLFFVYVGMLKVPRCFDNDQVNQVQKLEWDDAGCYVNTLNREWAWYSESGLPGKRWIKVESEKKKKILFK